MLHVLQVRCLCSLHVPLPAFCLQTGSQTLCFCSRNVSMMFFTSFQVPRGKLNVCKAFIIGCLRSCNERQCTLSSSNRLQTHPETLLLRYTKCILNPGMVLGQRKRLSLCFLQARHHAALATTSSRSQGNSSRCTSTNTSKAIQVASQHQFEKKPTMQHQILRTI